MSKADSTRRGFDPTAADPTWRPTSSSRPRLEEPRPENVSLRSCAPSGRTPGCTSGSKSGRLAGAFSSRRAQLALLQLQSNGRVEEPYRALLVGRVTELLGRAWDCTPARIKLPGAVRRRALRPRPARLPVARGPSGGSQRRGRPPSAAPGRGGSRARGNGVFARRRSYRR
jgi:hypothetical protein